MCCFSGDIEDVRATKIFVRKSGLGRQMLVYSMTFASGPETEVAMILPLPVPPSPREDVVRFISLENCADFFDALDEGFTKKEWEVEALAAATGAGSSPVERPPLVVYGVGSFDASFVPTLRDFDRLDPRFRLPDDAWKHFPQYSDYGFAVFKLRTDGEPVKFHPMAFEFPSRNPQSIFVPTVHIHDQRYHAVARFDHDIYSQPDQNERFGPGFEESSGPAASFMDVKRTDGIVNGQAPCFRQTVRATYRNADLFIERGQSDLLGLRLQGKLEDMPYPGGIHELVDSLLDEIFLHHPAEIDECRQRHLPPSQPRTSEDWRERERLLEIAKKDLEGLLRDQIRLAREIFNRRSPKGLLNAPAYFEAGVNSKLGSALRPR